MFIDLFVSTIDRCNIRGRIRERNIEKVKYKEADPR